MQKGAYIAKEETEKTPIVLPRGRQLVNGIFRIRTLVSSPSWDYFSS